MSLIHSEPNSLKLLEPKASECEADTGFGQRQRL